MPFIGVSGGKAEYPTESVNYSCNRTSPPVSGAEGPGVDRAFGRKETITSNLNEHFPHERPPDAALLTATLRVIAEAWDVTFQDLAMTDWHSRGDKKTLCGYLVR